MHIYFYKKIADYNKRNHGKKFNKLKLLEELHEFAEVLVKSMTKKDQDFDKQITEEMADLFIRLDVLYSTLSKSQLKTLTSHKNNKLKSLSNKVMNEKKSSAKV